MTVATLTLRDFLLARVAEDEAAAREAQGASRYHWGNTAFQEAVELADGEGACDSATDHMTRWDPARVLAECEAKRRVADMHSNWHGPETRGPNRGLGLPRSDDYAVATRQALTAVLYQLALPYSDHPDYNPVWRP